MGQDVNMTADGKIIQKVIKFNGVRKAIAKNFKIEQSGEFYAGGCSYIKCDVSAVQEARKKFLEEAHKSSYTVIYIKLLAKKKKKAPILNASFDGKKIEIYESKNIAIGISAPGNLLFAPVIRDVQTKGLIQIAAELKEIINGINNGTLPMESMEGGTFTLSSLGMRDVCAFQTVVSPGQVACMGIGRCKDEPVVENGQIVIRPINYFSTNVNHAAVMGADVCDFYDAFEEAIKNPMDYLYL